jgi:hypothetical protein
MKCCPLCGQDLPSKQPKRICFMCRQPIKRTHKWVIGNEGRICHVDCLNPEQHMRKPEQVHKLTHEQMSLI